MFDNFLYNSVKLVLLALLSCGVYFGYFLIVKPYLWRRKYQKYPNVLVSEKFIPIVGDTVKEINCMNENKVHYAYYEEDAHITRKYDLMAKLEGADPLMIIVSNKAMGEFLELQKRGLIDKYDNGRGMQVMLKNSITSRSCTPDVIQRRKNIVKWLGLNTASQFIPRMITLCKGTLDAMVKEREDVDILHHNNLLTFNVLASILFGEDADKMIKGTYPYLNSDGSTDDINLREMFLRVIKAYLEQHFYPLTNIVPFLGRYKLVEPYKRDAHNLQTLEKEIHNLVSNSKDPDSVGSKIYACKDLTDAQKVSDIILIMLGGSEATAHSIVSTLYLLQKNPEVIQKLRDELEANGLGKDSDFEKNCTRENIQNCDYLNYVIKESMRKDNPEATTFEYEATQNIQICGVPLSKGQGMRLDIPTPKFDEDKWLNPHDFVPERHDPDSEFYQEAKKQGKIADAYTIRNFSLGNRSCPGQFLAMLEQRVFLSYFIPRMGWEFSQQDLDHQGIGFGMCTQFEPKIKISRR